MVSDLWPAHVSEYIRETIEPESRAGYIIRFILSLKIPDGALAGQAFAVADFQADAVAKAYPGQPGDTRIITSAILSIPRKNGKTAFIAALLLAHLCGPEAVAFGQLYSVAFDKGQAGVVYNLARNMIIQDADLVAQIAITESDKMLTDRESKSVYMALSSEGRSHHGKSPSFLVFDELAQFNTNDEMYSVLTTGQGAHMGNALTWIISTQAPNDDALLSKLIDTYKDNHDPSVLCLLYAAPDDCDPFNEQTWLDCNPGIAAGFRSLEELADKAKKAKEIPSLQARFENLYLNRRISADDFYIAPALWAENGGTIAMEQLKGRPCYGGLDLSQKNDLTALVLIFPGAEYEERDTVISYFWKPGNTIAEHERRDIVPYSLWVKDGWIEATPGPIIDYRYIVERLIQVNDDYDFRGLGFDRWKIEDLKRHAEDADLFINMVPIGQGYKDMSPCVESLEDYLLLRQINHGNNPVLKWNASNAVVTTDPTGARKLDKTKSRNKIDGIVALTMATRMATIAEDEGEYFDVM